MWFSACQSMLQPAFPKGKTRAVSDEESTAAFAFVRKNRGLGTLLVQNAPDGLGNTAMIASTASAQRQRSLRPPWASQRAHTSAARSTMNIESRTGRIERVTGSFAGSSQGPGSKALPL